MVHAGGRPRTVSLAPEDMILLGEEMIKWVNDNDPIHLSQFYSIHKHYTESQWDTMCRTNEFFPYYEQALRTIGLKYLKKDSNIEPSVKQRWQRVYFKDLRKEEDETVKYNESVKAANPKSGDTYVFYGQDSAAYTDGQIPPKNLPKKDS